MKKEISFRRKKTSLRIGKLAGKLLNRSRYRLRKPKTIGDYLASLAGSALSQRENEGKRDTKFKRKSLS